MKDKTGFDCDAALKHVMEEQEDDGENTILKTGAPERRVKKEEPAATGRRTTPKYNVVSAEKSSKYDLFVKNGNNLYLYSHITGNGKTEWTDKSDPVQIVCTQTSDLCSFF